LIGAFIITIIRNGLNILGIASDMQTVIIGLVIVFAVYIDVLRRRKQQ
ncbi:MAG: ABC transporter permease, partial [Bacillota bacterium]|jgi:ribose transport system permease protein